MPRARRAGELARGCGRRCAHCVASSGALARADDRARPRNLFSVVWIARSTRSLGAARRRRAQPAAAPPGGANYPSACGAAAAAPRSPLFPQPRLVPCRARQHRPAPRQRASSLSSGGHTPSAGESARNSASALRGAFLAEWPQRGFRRLAMRCDAPLVAAARVGRGRPCGGGRAGGRVLVRRAGGLLRATNAQNPTAWLGGGEVTAVEAGAGGVGVAFIITHHCHHRRRPPRRRRCRRAASPPPCSAAPTRAKAPPACGRAGSQVFPTALFAHGRRKFMHLKMSAVSFSV